MDNNMSDMFMRLRVQEIVEILKSIDKKLDKIANREIQDDLKELNEFKTYIETRYAKSRVDSYANPSVSNFDMQNNYKVLLEQVNKIIDDIKGE